MSLRQWKQAPTLKLLQALTIQNFTQKDSSQSLEMAMTIVMEVSIHFATGDLRMNVYCMVIMMGVGAYPFMATVDGYF